MFSRDTWKEIFETIRKNKLRTFLSGFTVALGILIFIILYGFGNGLKNQFDEFFSDDSTNIMYLFPGKTTRPYKGYKSERRIEFKNEDIEDIEETFGMFVDFTTPRITRSGVTKYKNESNTYPTRAVAPSHMEAERTIIMKGRYINVKDVEEKAKVVVIGRLVEKDLFKGDDPLEKYINISGTAYKIVGVFQDEGGDNEERIIFMPYTTRQLIEKNNDRVDQIIVGFKPEIGYAGIMAFQKSLDKYLREKKNIHPRDPNGIFIRNVADQYKQNQQFATVLQIIVTFFSIGTLIAGIIGISNIMVFVVKERTKELGIRKALGATPKQVISTILFESIFITTISGFVGLTIGIAILTLTGEALEDFFIKNPYVDMGVSIFATIVLIIFGGIAGYIPAKKAANIKPIVALRDE
jgi:putative ABC transport system permease protein